jgi:hypothetical protein
MPTHPDQTAIAAGRARISSQPGPHGTARPGGGGGAAAVGGAGCGDWPGRFVGRDGGDRAGPGAGRGYCGGGGHRLVCLVRAGGGAVAPPAGGGPVRAAPRRERCAGQVAGARVSHAGTSAGAPVRAGQRRSGVRVPAAPGGFPPRGRIRPGSVCGRCAARWGRCALPAGGREQRDGTGLVQARRSLADGCGPGTRFAGVRVRPGGFARCDNGEGVKRPPA